MVNVGRGDPLHHGHSAPSTTVTSLKAECGLTTAAEVTHQDQLSNTVATHWKYR